MTERSRGTTPLVLHGITWDHPRGVGGLLESAPLLLERHNVAVQWEARSLLSFGDQPIADFAADFDLMIIDHPHVSDAVDATALLPLDEHLTSDVLETLERESVGSSHQSYRYRGRQWALAVDAAAQVSAFRPDLCDGVPPYWPDVLRAAQKGGVLWPYKPVDAFSTFATLLAQLGAPLAAPGLFVDREAAFRALEFMIKLAEAVPPWCARANPIDISEALVGDEGFSMAVALFGYTNYSRCDFRRKALVYDDIPSFDGRAGGSTLGGAGIAVSATTSHPETASAVAATLAAAEVQGGPYTAGGGQPGNLRAWKSEAANASTRDFFRNTLRTLERAWVRPRVLGWSALQLELSHLLHESLTRRSVDDTVLSRMEELPRLFLKEPMT